LPVIHLAPLQTRTLADLHSLGRTPRPPTWIEEVEDFIHGEGSQAALLGRATGILVYEDGEPIGVAILKPHDHHQGTELLQAFLIGHEHRGRKLAKPALRAVLESPATTDRSHIVWLVHPDNAAMQIVSEAGSHAIDRGAGDDGYDLFIFDR